MLRSTVLALALILGPAAFAQQVNTTCQQVGAFTYCNGQVQQQNSGVTNWLPNLQTPNMAEAAERGREEALQNQIAQQQLDNARTQAQLQQELQAQQSAMLAEQPQVAAANESAPAAPPTFTATKLDVGEYRAGGWNDGLTTIYLGGAMNAFTAANEILLEDKKPPLYCAPNNVTVDLKTAKFLLGTMIGSIPEDRRAITDPVPISGMLLLVLQRNYPCSPPAPKAQAHRQK